MGLRESEIEAMYLKENGIPWMGRHPPVAPTLPMYSPGKGIGEVAHVVKLREPGNDRTELKLISLTEGFPQGPRSFLIRDLLSVEETQHIVKLAENRLRKSGVGIEGRESNTRTS